MLVLSRRMDEEIVIGDDIIIKILRVTADGVVRVGISAPRVIPVHRREVYEALRRWERDGRAEA